MGARGFEPARAFFRHRRGDGAAVFLIAALGYGWARAGLPYSGPFITTFMINVATPCLVFATLLRLRFEATELAIVAGASVLCLTLSAGVGIPDPAPVRAVPADLSAGADLPNSGNMGMPLCLFSVRRGEGLGWPWSSSPVLAVAQFRTRGPAIAAGPACDLRQMLRTPLVHAVALALLLQALVVDLPRWAANTTMLLGDCAVPLMLVSLGVALADLRIAGIGRAARPVRHASRHGLHRRPRRGHGHGPGRNGPRRRHARERDAGGGVQTICWAVPLQHRHRRRWRAWSWARPSCPSSHCRYCCWLSRVGLRAERQG